MISNKKIFSAAVFSFLTFFSSLVLAHAPGDNPSRPDDSPSGRTPGSAISQGEWEARAQTEILNVKALIEQTEKELTEVKDKAKADWAKSVELTKKINDLGYDNTQKIESLESQISIIDQFIKLSKDPTTTKAVWDAEAQKVFETNNDLANFLIKIRTVPDFLTIIKNDLSGTLSEEKEIKDILIRAKEERGQVQATVAEEGALYEQLRTKLEEYKTAQDNLNKITALLDTDPNAAARYIKEKNSVPPDDSSRHI